MKRAIGQNCKKFWIAPQIVLCLLLVGCAGPRSFGPYMGKVVDAETNEPIEGAVVFIRFDTMLKYITVGGPTTEYAGSVEVLTNEDGEFYIPAQVVKLFRMLHGWDPSSWGMVFKPGYGAFPRHERSYRSTTEGAEVIPEEEYVVVGLPKLLNRKERLDNLGNLWYGVIDEIPLEKQRMILKSTYMEEIELGLRKGEDLKKLLR